MTKSDMDVGQFPPRRKETSQLEDCILAHVLRSVWDKESVEKENTTNLFPLRPGWWPITLSSIEKAPFLLVLFCSHKNT